MPVHVQICCNDWRNGADTGYCENVEMFGCELVGGNRVRTGWSREKVPGSNQAEGDETFIFGRLKLPCLGYRTWYGNWCWDVATLRLVHAVRIWNYLVKRGDWHCEGGPCELYDLFNAHREIDPKTAPELLTRCKAAV